MTTLDSTPLFDRLRGARRVLLAGAGGGFDVYAAIPLYLHLQARGVEVHLANQTFTDLGLTDAPEVCEGLRRVRADSMGAHGYFPEKWLCPPARGARGGGPDGVDPRPRRRPSGPGGPTCGSPRRSRSTRSCSSTGARTS